MTIQPGLFILVLAFGVACSDPPDPVPPSRPRTPASAPAPAPVPGSAAASRPAAPDGAPSESCPADRGGCPASAPLPACSPDVKPIAVADLVANRKRWKGKRVSVRGPLHAGLEITCTTLACAPENRCCNLCSAELVIGEPDEAFTRSFRVHSAGVMDGDDWLCGGDETAVCCRHGADGRDAIVTGILSPPTPSTPPDRRLIVLTHATVCLPASQ